MLLLLVVVPVMRCLVLIGPQLSVLSVICVLLIGLAGGVVVNFLVLLLLTLLMWLCSLIMTCLVAPPLTLGTCASVATLLPCIRCVNLLVSVFDRTVSVAPVLMLEIPSRAWNSVCLVL